MENVQTYIVVRDPDLDALTDAVNERIDEGYELAGPLLCVPAAGKEARLFVQPMTLALVEEDGEDEDEDEEDDDESFDSDADEDEVRASVDGSPVFRRR